MSVFEGGGGLQQNISLFGGTFPDKEVQKSDPMVAHPSRQPSLLQEMF